jgi:sodium-dependent dicarboxylate transporter 2/3/5
MCYFVLKKLTGLFLTNRLQRIYLQNTIFKKNRHLLHWLKILIGPFLGALLGFITYNASGQGNIGIMVMIVIWMAVWWVTEIVPLAVTSMIPVFAFPVSGLMTTSEVSSVYMNDVLFLFVGGFMMSFAMERWNLHHRIALKIILIVGTDGSKILLGLMLCSYIISMWISNTAITMMLIPTTLAIIHKIDTLKINHSEKIAKGLLLGIAHASTFGGVATMVGTPTNMIFVSYFNREFEGNTQITFFKWFLFAVPLSLCMLVIGYFILKFFFMPKKHENSIKVDKSIFEKELNAMGSMSFEEKCVAMLFSILVVLWFTRADLVLGSYTFRGWSNLFSQPKFIQDGAVAVAIAMLLFIIPAKKEKSALLKWEHVKKLPYSVILLFGGGFALSKGFDDSGLTAWLSGQLNFLQQLPPFLIVVSLCIFVILISEFASNMATIQLCLPILMAISISTNISPLLLMIPATVAASYAFMMPVGTAPNTIIFGSERLRTTDMMKPGIWLNLSAVVIISIFMFTWGKWVFGL